MIQTGPGWKSLLQCLEYVAEPRNLSNLDWLIKRYSWIYLPNGLRRRAYHLIILDAAVSTRCMILLFPSITKVGRMSLTMARWYANCPISPVSVSCRTSRAGKRQRANRKSASTLRLLKESQAFGFGILGMRNLAASPVG